MSEVINLGMVGTPESAQGKLRDMLNCVFNKGLVLVRFAETSQDFPASYEVQHLAHNAANAVGDVFLVKLWADFEYCLLKSLMDRHDQPVCDQIAGDGIGPHLPVDDLQQAIVVRRSEVRIKVAANVCAQNLFEICRRILFIKLF